MDEVQFLAERAVTVGYQPDRMSEELLAKAYQALNGQQGDDRSARDSVQAGSEASLETGALQEAGR